MVPDHFQVVIERGADADLRSIAAYLAEHGSNATAAEFVEGVLSRLDSLERFPLRGSAPKELERVGKARYRQLFFGRYRLIYKVAGQTVTVILIADGRRDMQALFRDRLFDSDRTA